MKILVFTSNNPRHISLVERCAEVADEVSVVQECVTVFPGKVEDFYRKTPVMQEYFSRVMAAERTVFGAPRFIPQGVRTLALRMGDVSLAPVEIFQAALDADVIIVFGASYIRAPLVDLLIERRAVNIHMGISPYYRGSSCNFWALYDNRPDMVGATIHMLSRGLDSGAMLFHARPAVQAEDSFVFGMRAVKAAHDSLLEMISRNELFQLPAHPQDKTKQIRYTRNADFTDHVAREFLDRKLTAQDVLNGLLVPGTEEFLNVQFGQT